MALQHIRSSTLDKRPQPASLSDGQLAINTNVNAPGVFFKDSNGTLVKVGPTFVGTTAPNSTPASGGASGNTLGEQWLDTSGTNPVLKIWDGSAWQSEAGEFVNVSGDTMTGALVMDNQQQIRFRETTANGTNYIALQAPASVAFDKTITLPDVTGTVVTTGDTGSVTSTMILDGTIVNGDVNASAAIAGTKISPDFGSQTVQTTGVFSAAGGAAATPSITFTGDLNTGLWSPTADTIAASTGGSERLRIDSSGRLGLGTSVPGQLIDVQGNSNPQIKVSETNNSTSAGFIIENQGQRNWQIWADRATDTFRIGNNSRATTNLVIDSSGRLGIGVTGPQFPIDVAKSQNSETLIQVGNFDAGAAAVTGYRAIGDSAKFADYKINAAFSLAQLIGGNGIASLFYDFDTHVWRKNDATERARIDSSGRLLVGTSTARSNFFNSTISPIVQVEGLSGFASLTRSLDDVFFPCLVLGKTRGVGNVIVQSNDEIGRISFQGNDGSEFVEGAYINAAIDGTPGADDMPSRLTFATTADGASSPTERMRIANDGLCAYYTAGSNALYISSAAAANTANNLIAGLYSATGVVTGTVSYVVRTNGNVENTNNSYGALSDIKLKENIVDANSQWDDLKALQVRNYNFKEGQTHTQIGLIAQEAELVSPGLVSESPDRDEEGNDLGTVTKSVNYSVLYMKAVKALQEAMERIETLEAKVAALEAS